MTENHTTQLLRTSSELKQLGAILFIGAHPDDETFCCGALLAAAAANGQRVICATATWGEAGVQDPGRWPPEQLGDIRRHELQAGLKELGIVEHHCLGYEDGFCQQASQDEAAQQIAWLIEQGRIDSILTFGSDGLTGHPDHQAVSRWVDTAVRVSERKPRVYHIVQPRDMYERYMRTADEQLDIFFNIDTPPLADEAGCSVYFESPDIFIKRKYAAFRAMPSQMTSLLDYFPFEAFALALGTEALVEATAENTDER